MNASEDFHNRMTQIPAKVQWLAPASSALGGFWQVYLESLKFQ